MKDKFIITASVIISAGIILAVLIVIAPSYQLVIEEKQTGYELWSLPVQEGDWFRHEYLHSVEKSKVIEKFKLGAEGQILAMESWTKSFGAGLPYENKGTVEQIDGYYVLKDISEPVEVLHIIPSHLYLHTFHLGDTEVVLSEPPFKRTLLLIEIRKLTIRERAGYYFKLN